MSIHDADHLWYMINKRRSRTRRRIRQTGSGLCRGPFFILLFIVYLPYQIKGCRRFLLVFHGGGLTMQRKPGRGRHCDLYKPVWCNGNTPGFDPVVISSNLIIGARLWKTFNRSMDPRHGRKRGGRLRQVAGDCVRYVYRAAWSSRGRSSTIRSTWPRRM